MLTLDDQIRRLASRCGECGKHFGNPGEVFYLRQQPARLICLDCQMREQRGEKK